MGWKRLILRIITKSSWPKLFAVGGLQPFRRSEAHLDDTTSHPPVIHSDQMTDNSDRQGHGYRNISLGSLDSRTGAQIGGFDRISNSAIRNNPLGTIISNCPHVTRKGY